MNSIRPMDVIIDGVIVVIGVWAYGKYMYMKGKMDSKKGENK